MLIPVYSADKYLEKFLDSIDRQDYRDLEIIIVDDGQSDGSFSIYKEYAAEDVLKGKAMLYQTGRPLSYEQLVKGE